MADDNATAADAPDPTDGGTDAATADESAADRETEETDGAPALHERVAAHDEDLGAEVAALEERAADLEAELAETEAELDDVTDRLQRTRADFQNYKKRAKREREQFRERATEDLVERLLDVRDNLGRALDQDDDADIRDGVEATRRAFDDVLAAENVERIDPDPGTAVDPERHEVLTRVDADAAVEPGTVADVYRPGYEMGGKVIRAAQVTVAEDSA